MIADCDTAGYIYHYSPVNTITPFISVHFTMMLMIVILPAITYHYSPVNTIAAFISVHFTMMLMIVILPAIIYH